MEIRYRPTVGNDLMQIVDGKEVGTLGVRLAPDTADLFASAPEMATRIAALESSLAERERECERLRTACEYVVVTAHGNRYGLNTEDVLEAQLLAAGECEEAMGSAVVARLLKRHGLDAK